MLWCSLYGSRVPADAHRLNDGLTNRSGATHFGGHLDCPRLRFLIEAMRQCLMYNFYVRPPELSDRFANLVRGELRVRGRHVAEINCEADVDRVGLVVSHFSLQCFSSTAPSRHRRFLAW